MKKIKVYLQYPWIFPDSPYYKYLLQNTFNGLEYVNAQQKEAGVTSNIKKFKALFFVKSLIRKSLDNLNIALPNAHKTNYRGEFDLIHCAHCLSINRNKPWVADMESWWSMWLSGHFNKTGNRRVSKIIMSPNCKKIMPWTKKTASMIEKYLPVAKSKLEVVYPAIPCSKKLNRKPKEIIIIYAARDFQLKGGEIALRVISELKIKYPSIKEEIYAEVPSEMNKKYSNLNILGLISQEKLLKRFEEAHILLYPSLMDTFGFAILEAMSRGCIPVAVENGNYTPAIQELIENEKTGCYVSLNIRPEKKISESEIRIASNKILSVIEDLLENKKKIATISSNCFKEIKSGKFSLAERNKKLKRIYTEAIK